MDILQFLSSIIGSLAWPSVIIYFLFLIRKQVIPLVRRLSEVSLPGGTKASFREELEGAKDQALSFAVNEKEEQAIIESTSKEVTRPNILLEITSDQKSKQIIAETIWDIYEKTEEYMRRKIQKIPLENRKIPADFVFYDLREIEGGIELYEMWSRIQDISKTSRRNSSLEVDSQDVRSYRDICNLYLRRFDDIMQLWIEKGPRSMFGAD